MSNSRSSRSSQSSKQRTFLRRCSIQTATSKSSVHHLEESAEEMGRVDGAHSFRFMAEGNMWLLELGASGIRVLADPWLVDNLIFWEQPWLFTGKIFILFFASSSDLPPQFFSHLHWSCDVVCTSIILTWWRIISSYRRCRKQTATNCWRRSMVHRRQDCALRVLQQNPKPYLLTEYGVQKTGLSV